MPAEAKSQFLQQTLAAETLASESMRAEAKPQFLP